MAPMFPNGATEEDRYRGVTVDSSKFGTEEVITAEKFESILNEVRVIKLYILTLRVNYFKLYNLHAVSMYLHKVWSYIGPIKLLNKH